jgi:glycosyltransferase involved in cell wall biosynthesis
VVAFTIFGGKVVIVDGSEDGSGKRLEKEFRQIQNLKLVRTENQGSAAARNKCLE